MIKESKHTPETDAIDDARSPDTNGHEGWMVAYFAMMNHAKQKELQAARLSEQLGMMSLCDPTILERTLRERDELKAEVARLSDRTIIGWAVHTDKIENAAMYCLCEKIMAFDAARRWKANITALVFHPDAPTH